VTTVAELIPGQIVSHLWPEVPNGIKRAVFVARTEHPVYPSLQLRPTTNGLAGDAFA